MKRLLLLVLVMGCQGPGDLLLPRIVSSELTAAGPLVQALTLELERPVAVEVEYRAEGAPPLRVSSPSARRHTLYLTRLRAGTAYEFEIKHLDERGSFLTDPLPPDLAAIRFDASGVSTLPLVLVHVTTDSGFRGYVVVDEDGEVVWYARTVGFPFGMTRRENGHFVFMDAERGLFEVTPDGMVVAHLPQDNVNREMHHDVIATSSNSVLFLAFDTRSWEGTPLKGEAIWEWWPETGQTEKRWSAWDHLSPDSDRGPRFGAEWMHANSLSIGPRGNVLVSVHYFDQVISIAPGWAGLEWRLGGVNATIAVSEEDRFSGQHTAAELAPGRVVLFDNGVDRGEFSRAIEFELTESGALRAWEWRASPDNFGFAVGSARRLPSGNTLIAFGMRAGFLGSIGGTEVYEVAPGGEAVWHLRVDGPSVMYRAEPLLSIAGEER